MMRPRTMLILPLCLFLCHLLAPTRADEPSCNLQCQNQGVCKLGKPEFGFATDLEDEDILPFSKQDHNMHCSCPAGFTGLHCEIAFVTCSYNGEDKHTCFNGGECQQSETEDGEPFYHCECDRARSDFSNAYAGHFCQHVATVMCTYVDSSARHSFCTNGGTCREQIEGDQEHPGCNCGKDWVGDHCEFVKGSFLGNRYEGKTGKSKDYDGVFSAADHSFGLGIIVTLSVAAAFLVIAGVVLVRKFKSRKEKTKASNSSGRSYEEDGLTRDPTTSFI